MLRLLGVIGQNCHPQLNPIGTISESRRFLRGKPEPFQKLLVIFRGVPLEIAVPAVHLRIGKSGMFHNADPPVFVHAVGVPEKNFRLLQQGNDEALLLPDSRHFIIQLGQPLFQEFGQTPVFRIHNVPNIAELQTGLSIGADLFKHAASFFV